MDQEIIQAIVDLGGNANLFIWLWFISRTLEQVVVVAFIVVIIKGIAKFLRSNPS